MTRPLSFEPGLQAVVYLTGDGRSLILDDERTTTFGTLRELSPLERQVAATRLRYWATALENPMLDHIAVAPLPDSDVIAANLKAIDDELATPWRADR